MVSKTTWRLSRAGVPRAAGFYVSGICGEDVALLRRLHTRAS